MGWRLEKGKIRLAGASGLPSGGFGISGCSARRESRFARHDPIIAIIVRGNAFCMVAAFKSDDHGSDGAVHGWPDIPWIQGRFMNERGHEAVLSVHCSLFTEF